PADDPRSRRRDRRSGRRRDAAEDEDSATGEVPRPPRARPGSRGGGRRARGASGGGRGRGPRGPRASGGAAVLQQPRARLLLGVAFAAILIVVIALVVKDCQRSQLEDSYTSY